MGQMERFWRRVQRCEHGEDCALCCWEWNGARSEQGYGRSRYVLLGSQETYVHRVAWAFAHGALAGANEVCHSCDNPPCCNPAHLWAGTHQDNHADSVRKGRRSHASKAKKLTPRKVASIRKLWRDGQKQRHIAERFGVSQPAVSQVISGKSWH